METTGIVLEEQRKGGLIVSGPGVSVGHRILSPAKVRFEWGLEERRGALQRGKAARETPEVRPVV